MKSVQISKPGDIQLVDIPEPLIGPGDVLLKISYVGFCGSDLNSYLGLNPMVNYPVIPGHEISGTVVEKGIDENSLNNLKKRAFRYSGMNEYLSSGKNDQK